MKVRSLIFALLICILSDAQTTIFKVQAGVSQTLAIARKKNLSGIHYELDLDIPAEKSQPVTAHVTITLTIADHSQYLQIDFKDSVNKLRSLHVNGKKTPVHFYKEHILIAPYLLKKGINRIDIDFVAGELSLNRKENFFYTLLVPDRARTFFPCFDQPDLKARFTVSLKLPEDWTAITNAPLKTKGSRLQYETSDLIPTYLFSIAAGKFYQVSQTLDGRIMNFILRETDSLKLQSSLDSIFNLHVKSLKYLEDYTRIKYPFKKFDFAAIPDFQYGGMEHVGAIDYRSSTLFLDFAATQTQRNSRSNLIAHETAHMWFGDLVTMKWFNDVWMKEVFANFMADKINRNPAFQKQYELKFLTTHFPSAYSIDRTKGANPIRQPLENLNEAGTLYGPIIYNKAPIMMQQLEMLMGEIPFRNGVREYLKKYSFQNADWPQLVGILDRYTSADLKAWNEVWVNSPGRPVISYEFKKAGNYIQHYSFSQKNETNTKYFLPQVFEIALIYEDTIKKLKVNMTGATFDLSVADGKYQAPLCFVFNSSGTGYGLFPVDTAVMSRMNKITDPVMRTSVYINLYENMLEGKKGLWPTEMLKWYTEALKIENEELNVSLVLGYIENIYRRFLRPETRKQITTALEYNLWDQIDKPIPPGKKKLLFRTLVNIASDPGVVEWLYGIWKNKAPIPGVNLNEDDYTALAIQLYIQEIRDRNIINEQINRISNPDRKKRLQFMIPALSDNFATRDSFFQSLKNLDVRKNESWVEEALGYFHQYTNTKMNGKYLMESLEMLEEIQRTGDIFFPAGWLNATFRHYQSPEALSIVKHFLASHPDYNTKLKMKILQATDMLERAVKIAE